MDYYKKIERSVTISADKRSTVDLQVDIWSQDLNVTKFILKLDTTDSTAIDLTSATVRVAMVYNQDGTDVKIEAAGIVEDVTTQKIAYIMDDKLAGFEGQVTAGFYVTLSTGQRIDIQNVTFNMRKSLLDKDLEAAEESYYQTFDDIVADVQSEGENAKTEINAVLPTVQAQVSELDRQIKALPQIPDLFVAYANSADGSVDFSKVKPKENIYTSSLIKWRNNINNDNDVFTMSTLTRGDINSIQFQFYTSGNQYIKEANITNVKLGRLGIKLIVPDNANYVRIYATNEPRTLSSSLDIFIDKLANKTITISFDLSVNSDNKYLYSKFKISEDEIVFYLPNKAVNYRDSFMKYIGYSVKDSTNPSDYRWTVNPEWQRAQLDYERAVVDNYLSIELNAPTIYSKSKIDSNPINSILTTLSAENPSTTLGGTWTQLGTETKFSNTIYYWKRTQ